MRQPAGRRQGTRQRFAHALKRARRWGCKLSAKQFVGPEYVRKHILTKHTALVDDVRAKALDAVFCENYVRHAEAVEAAGGTVRPPDADRDARSRFRAQPRHAGAPRFDGDMDGAGGGGAATAGAGGGRGGRRGRDRDFGPPYGGHLPLQPAGSALGGAAQVFVPAPGASPTALLDASRRGSGMPSAAYVDLDAQATHGSGRPILDYGDI